MNQTQIDLKTEKDRLENIIMQLSFSIDEIDKILNKKY